MEVIYNDTNNELNDFRLQNLPFKEQKRYEWAGFQLF